MVDMARGQRDGLLAVPRVRYVREGEGTNEFGVLLGDRFVVNAEGSGVTLNDLKAAVSALNLGKLESIKGVGVQKWAAPRLWASRRAASPASLPEGKTYTTSARVFHVSFRARRRRWCRG